MSLLTPSDFEKTQAELLEEVGRLREQLATSKQPLDPLRVRERQSLLRPPMGSAPPETPLVLVVENDLQQRQLLVAQLAKEYRVEVAVNGLEALALTRALHPDLVLAELMVPLICGDELLASLRAERGYDDVAVVLLLDREDEELRLRLLEAGAQDSLAKPFSPQDLRPRLRALLAPGRTPRLAQGEPAISQHELEYPLRRGAEPAREVEQDGHRLGESPVQGRNCPGEKISND
jgi:CheY-like chemotaxis protein